MRIQLRLLLVLMCACAPIADSNAADQTDKAVRTAKTCLPLITIDNINIVDRQNIVFRMKNHEYYVNRLPHTCPNLDDTRAIMYSTPLSSLCSLDIITVLDNIGGGFQSLGACGLGEFQPVSMEEIQRLKDHKTGP